MVSTCNFYFDVFSHNIYNNYKWKDEKKLNKYIDKYIQFFGIIIFTCLLTAGGISLVNEVIIPYSNVFIIIGITIIIVLSLFYIFKFKKTAKGLLGLSIITGLIYLFYLSIEYILNAIVEFGEWLAKTVTGLLMIALILISVVGIIFLLSKLWEVIFNESDS